MNSEQLRKVSKTLHLPSCVPIISRDYIAIIAVPIEEYSRAGPQGAMRSVIRAVPVAILRPVIGLTEGISKVALGVRNDIAPDALKTDLKNKYKQ